MLQAKVAAVAKESKEVPRRFLPTREPNKISSIPAFTQKFGWDSHTMGLFVG